MANKTERILLIAILGIAGLLAWRHLGTTVDSPQETRPQITVTPRGNLADDEQTTIKLFADAAPSVVHITTHALERDFFSLNVMEIPKGTGTGFVWDRSGHIVTNLHVIQEADASRIALADHSTWQACSPQETGISVG